MNRYHQREGFVHEETVLNKKGKEVYKYRLRNRRDETVNDFSSSEDEFGNKAAFYLVIL